MLGYYLDPVQVIVATAGAWSSSNRVTAVTKTAVGEWTIKANDLTSPCPVQVSTEEPGVIAHASAGFNMVPVSVRRLDGTPVDTWFTVTAMC